MSTNLEQLKNEIQQLPPTEREILKERLDNGKTKETAEEKDKRAEIVEDEARFKKSLQWIGRYPKI